LFRAFHSEKSLAVGHLRDVLILKNLFLYSYTLIRDFRLPPRSRWELPSSG